LFQVESGVNSVENFFRFGFAYGSFLDESLEAVFDHLHAVIDEPLLDIPHANFEFASLSADLSYAMSH
jgi:hypothetical protein